MTRNKAEDTLENRLIDRIAELERQLRELSTPQPLGADVIDTIRLDYALSGPVTLLPEQSGFFGYAFDYVGNRALWNFAYSVYVDSSAADHAWPAGAALSPTQLLLDTAGNMDEVSMVDVDGSGNQKRTFWLWIRNHDTVNHNYYVRFKAFLPRSNISV